MARIVEQEGHAFRVHPVEEIGLLVDAADYYRAFYRAALGAERYILLSGWQFDSDVELLRGDEAARAEGPTSLLAFLNWLCGQKPELRVWILAWDFHLVFAAEREWMQELVFQWTTDERLQFRFDSNHVERGCHHQKFVVVDGELSFVGGLDLCDDRWDARDHREHNPLRTSRGEPHQPFHDIQAYAHGTALAGSLAELFACRWARADGQPMNLPPSPAASRPHSTPQGLLPLAADHAALSRTDPYGAPSGPERCVEIEALHLAAIAAAEQLIYIETQYLSARTIGEALTARFRAAGRPPLEVVLVLNKRGETLKEQAAVGLAQAQLIRRLRKVAAETGHALGIFYTLPATDEGREADHPTYIHSKLMIVDDRLLTVGSANLTNRSMVVDTELNLSVEADGASDRDMSLGTSIRDIRTALLAEHTGGAMLPQVTGLVSALEDLAARGASGDCNGPYRLRHHPAPDLGEQAALALIDPQKLPFDPDEIEAFDEGAKLDFLNGLGRAVRELFSSRRDRG
jgi:phospholipase D1/2